MAPQNNMPSAPPKPEKKANKRQTLEQQQQEWYNNVCDHIQRNYELTREFQAHGKLLFGPTLGHDTQQPDPAHMYKTRVAGPHFQGGFAPPSEQRHPSFQPPPFGLVPPPQWFNGVPNVSQNGVMPPFPPNTQQNQAHKTQVAGPHFHGDFAPPSVQRHPSFQPPPFGPVPSPQWFNGVPNVSQNGVMPPFPPNTQQNWSLMPAPGHSNRESPTQGLQNQHKQSFQIHMHGSEPLGASTQPQMHPVQHPDFLHNGPAPYHNGPAGTSTQPQMHPAQHPEFFHNGPAPYHNGPTVYHNGPTVYHNGPGHYHNVPVPVNGDLGQQKHMTMVNEFPNQMLVLEHERRVAFAQPQALPIGPRAAPYNFAVFQPHGGSGGYQNDQAPAVKHCAPALTTNNNMSQFQATGHAQQDLTHDITAQAAQNVDGTRRGQVKPTASRQKPKSHVTTIKATPQAKKRKSVVIEGDKTPSEQHGGSGLQSSQPNKRSKSLKGAQDPFLPACGLSAHMGASDQQLTDLSAQPIISGTSSVQEASSGLDVVEQNLCDLVGAYLAEPTPDAAAPALASSEPVAQEASHTTQQDQGTEGQNSSGDMFPAPDVTPKQVPQAATDFVEPEPEEPDFKFAAKAVPKTGINFWDDLYDPDLADTKWGSIWLQDI